MDPSKQSLIPDYTLTDDEYLLVDVLLSLLNKDTPYSYRDLEDNQFDDLIIKKYGERTKTTKRLLKVREDTSRSRMIWVIIHEKWLKPVFGTEMSMSVLTDQGFIAQKIGSKQYLIKKSTKIRRDEKRVRGKKESQKRKEDLLGRYKINWEKTKMVLTSKEAIICYLGAVVTVLLTIIAHSRGWV